MSSPLEVRTLHEQVTETVRRMIADGRLAEGQRINEVELAAELGVSRTPLRETLRLLASEGIIEVIPRRGAFVSRLSLEAALDMYEVAAALESLCAQLAAERRTRADVRRLFNLYGRLEGTARDGNLDDHLRYDDRLQDLLHEIARNDALAENASVVWRRLRGYRHRVMRHPGRLAVSLAERDRLLRAIEAADCAAAEQHMRAHLLRHCELLADLETPGT